MPMLRSATFSTRRVSFEVAHFGQGWKPGTSSAGGVSHRTAKNNAMRFRPEGPTHPPMYRPSGPKILYVRIPVAHATGTGCVDPPGLKMRNFKPESSGYDQGSTDGPICTGPVCNRDQLFRLLRFLRMNDCANTVVSKLHACCEPTPTWLEIAT
jgi:hypothetical protein